MNLNRNKTLCLAMASLLLGTALMAHAALVTFQVNMGAQLARGNFQPETDSVLVAGDALNNWNTTASPLTNRPTDTNLWVGTYPITEAPGTLVAYKVVLNGSTWESRANRTFTLSNAAQTLPVVYFNDAQSVPIDIPLTFRVDLSVQTALGNFDPTVDTVTAAGTFNGWEPSAFPLTNSPSNPHLFSGTVVDSNDGMGATIEFKFVVNGSVWESIANRAYTISSTNLQDLPTVYYNDVANLGLLSPSRGPGVQATLSWTAGPFVRLQSTTSLVPVLWQNVPNTQGQSNAVVTVNLGQKFYRLIGP